jgi:adenosylcobinamide-GDP ribazoletransferase
MKGLANEAAALQRWGNDVLVSLAFLTRLPVARWLPEPSGSLSQSMRGFPFVGLVLGLGAGLVFIVLHSLGFPALLCAVTALAVSIAATGGLHEDGLADTADGFGGGSGREEKLMIMRDSRIGTFGVIALVVTLIARTVSLGAAAGAAWYVPLCLLAATGAFSRALMVWLMATTETARADGLSATAGRPSGDATLAAMVAGLVLGGVLLMIASGVLAAILALAGGFLAAMAVRAGARRQIGGQTGDVCGAACVLAETVMLAIAAARFS